MTSATLHATSTAPSVAPATEETGGSDGGGTTTTLPSLASLGPSLRRRTVRRRVRGHPHLHTTGGIHHDDGVEAAQVTDRGRKGHRPVVADAEVHPAPVELPGGHGLYAGQAVER